MSTDYYLVCDATKFYCAAANACMGRAGDSGRTDRGKFSFVISHEHHDLRVVTEHNERVLDFYKPPHEREYLDWEDVKDDGIITGDGDIEWSLSAEEAKDLHKKVRARLKSEADVRAGNTLTKEDQARIAAAGRKALHREARRLGYDVTEATALEFVVKRNLPSADDKPKPPLTLVEVFEKEEKR